MKTFAMLFGRSVRVRLLEVSVLMVLTLSMSIATCICMLSAILFKPTVGIKVGAHKTSVGLYWVVALIGAVAIIAAGVIPVKDVWSGLTADSAVNPLKILTLFICNTALSVFLDEVGFFGYLAVKSLNKVKGSQKRFFVLLYALVSVLTVFTSNDIVVLTFTPFICYYAKNANIDPVPYLVGEFVAANSFSLMLMIGNPTNIYIATAYGIDFGRYFVVMFIPALLAGLSGFLMTYIIFRKRLSAPVEPSSEQANIADKPMLIVGLCALVLCTVLLAVSSYVGWEMWYISLAFALFIAVFGSIYSLCKKRKPAEIVRTLRRSPWELVPFVISMFVIVLALDAHGVTEFLGKVLDCGKWTAATFGGASFLFSDLINNIPMSVLFGSAAGYAASVEAAVYSSIIGSNIGAFLTPVGALAGIMWLNILKSQNVEFGFLRFVKYGVIISVPTLLVSIAGLYLSLWLF